MNILHWVAENYEEMLVGAVAILTGLAVLAKMTPSPKDDGVIAKILSWLKLIPVKGEEKDENPPTPN